MSERQGGQSAENDAGRIHRFAKVYHRHHGHGTVSSVSPDRQYAAVRYEAGYMRTHHVVELTRVTLPESSAR